MIKIKYILITFFNLNLYLLRIFFRSVSNRYKKSVVRKKISRIDYWRSDHKEQVRNILSILSSIASKQGIDLELSYGSLLGHIRHSGIMPWDDDVDLAISNTDIKVFLNLVMLDESLLFDEFVYAETGIKYYKFWLPDGAGIAGHKHTFPFVDIWIYTIGDDKWVDFSGSVKFPIERYFPTHKIVFEGADFGIPKDPLLCLDSLYSNWRSEIQVYPWSHRLEYFEFEPLTVSIVVDKMGKFVKYN